MFRDDEPMGTNKRYAHLPAQRDEERELRGARERGPLRTLDSLQLRLHAQPVTIVPEQVTIWGHAWLKFGDTNVRFVVQVTFDGDKLRCWIGQGACQRISGPTDVW